MDQLSLITGFGWGLAAGVVVSLLVLTTLLSYVDRNDEDDE